MERFNADLTTYAQSFHPVKDKINKRRRKLLDYDNARHDYDSIRAAKKPDDIKIAKVCSVALLLCFRGYPFVISEFDCIWQAADALKEAERHYNELNIELHRELPKLYDYRIDFLSSNLSRLYSTESTFHSETGKVGAAPKT